MNYNPPGVFIGTCDWLTQIEQQAIILVSLIYYTDIEWYYHNLDIFTMNVRPRRQAAEAALRILYDEPSDSEDDDIDLQFLPDAEAAVIDLPIVPYAEVDLQLLPEVDMDFDDDAYLNELSEEHLVVLTEDTDEEEEEEEEYDNYQPDDPQLMAPSGKAWTPLPMEQRRGRAPNRNILRARPGVVPGVNPTTAKESFLLYTDSIIDEVVRFTNLEARRCVTLFNRNHGQRKVWTPTTRDEMDAFIGLQILAGAFKANYRNTESLWSQRDGPPVFRATMSRERYLSIKRFFRFDDRQRRNPDDPLSPVRDIWNTFIDKLKQYYVPKEDLTIDEQLLEFHGRVKFRVYIKSKPAKYGIKIVWLCEAETGYALSAVPYIGEKTLTETEKQNMSVPGAVTMKVAQPYLDKGYNITADNWFTSCPLANNLFLRNTTIVGTIRSNSRDLPPKAKVTTGRQKKSIEHFVSDNQVLVSYWDKGTKPVILLSTMHSNAEVTPSGLPEIIQYYNSTKSGVDSMDRMIRYYTCKRKCFRWTYGFFCNIIDIALMNGSIVMRSINPPTDGKNNLFRYNFLLDVGYELVDAQIKKRLSGRLTKPISTAMLLIGYVKTHDGNLQDPQIRPKSGRCNECKRERDTKTTQRCSECEVFICTVHSTKVVRCLQCGN